MKKCNVIKKISFFMFFILLSGIIIPVKGSEIPSSSEVLKKAKESVVEYIKIVGTIQHLAPKIKYPEKLYSFIMILDQLERIGQEHDIDGFGANPIKELSYVLTEEAVKWIRFDQAKMVLVRQFFKWSQSGTLVKVARNHEMIINQVKTRKVLLRWNNVLSGVIRIIYDEKREPFVVSEYEILQFRIVQELFKISTDLTVKEVCHVIRSVNTIQAAQEAQAYLNMETFSTNDPDRLKNIIIWTVGLKFAVEKNIKQAIPFDVKNAPGELVREQFVKLFKLNSSPDISMSDQIIRTLDDRQLVRFINVVPDGGYDDMSRQQIEFLRVFSKKLAKKYDQNENEEQLARIEKIIEQLEIIRVLAVKNYEGRYQMKVDGVDSVMTIVYVGASNFIIGLTILKNNAEINYSLARITYNYRDNTFEAHRFAVDDPEYLIPILRNYYMKFKFHLDAEEKEMRIEGVFSDGLDFFTISGKRLNTFELYPTTTSFDISDITGVYLANSEEYPDFPAKYTITQVGQKLVGTFRPEGKYGEIITMNYGYYHKKRSIIYTTSGELQNGRWVQIRGQLLEEKRMIIDYIIGGRGVHPTIHQMILNKKEGGYYENN